MGGVFFGDRHVRVSGHALGKPNWQRPWQTQQKTEGKKRLTQQERVGGTEKYGRGEHPNKTTRLWYKRCVKQRSTVVASVCFGLVTGRSGTKPRLPPFVPHFMNLS
jgi:hypothetical protein